MIYDTLTIDDVIQPRLTRDGFLVADVNVARTGIQQYLARELGLDGDPNRVVKVYRPEEEVFAADAMQSYAYRPVTVDHPNQLVNADNWKEHARGQTGGDVLRDKEFVRVPMVLMDAGAINEWKQGKRELSMGYTMDLDTTPGKTPTGESYDAVQRNLRMNHLALVTRARGGSQLRLGDDDTGGNNMPEVKLTTVTVDGIPVDVTDAGAQVINKLLADLKAEREAKAQADSDHAAAIKAKDGELAAKDAKIDELEGKQLSDADLDKKVKDRADLISTAKTIADVDYSGQSENDIRKTAVTAKIGSDAIKGKSDDYIAARFDLLAEDAEKDPVRMTLGDQRQTTTGNGATDAYNQMVQRTQDAWKGEQPQQGGTH